MIDLVLSLDAGCVSAKKQLFLIENKPNEQGITDQALIDNVKKYFYIIYHDTVNMYKKTGIDYNYPITSSEKITLDFENLLKEFLSIPAIH